MLILKILAISIVFLFLILPLFFVGAPFMPSYRKSNKKDLEKLINYLKEKGSKKIIDIGSGDGRIVIEFAQQGFESYGVEINPLLVFLNRLKIKKSGLKNAKIIFGNFWRLNLSDFDIIYFFQYKTANKFLEAKLKKELQPDAIIISYGFPLSTFELVDQINEFFIYKKGVH